MPRLKDKPGSNVVQYTKAGNNHVCIHEDRWKKYFDFKETVTNFIAAKTVTNGNLEEKDKTLKEEIQDVKSDVKDLRNLLIIFMIGMITLVGLMLKI
jgi:hypothetical protein